MNLTRLITLLLFSTFLNCSSNTITPGSCGEIKNGEQQTRYCYHTDIVPENTICQYTEQTRTCVDGQWTEYPECEFLSCTVEGSSFLSCGNTLHGQQEYRDCYANATVPSGSNCVSTTQSRTCNNGNWEPDYPDCDNPTCTINGSIESNANKTTGVAPLSVHFTGGIVPGADNKKRFHEFEYLWNFGDPQSGTWSTSGKSKNSAKGPIAAHVFEQPGEFTVMLTIKDGSSMIDADTFTISVSDPDVVYSGTNTTCVSDTSNSDFSGCPQDATTITTDDLSTITQYATAGSRILLQRTSTWTIGNLIWPENKGPVTIGAFGSGAKPQIFVTGDTFLDLSYKQNWRILDVAFSDTTKSASVFNGLTAFKDITILRIDSEGFADPIGWTHWNESAIIPIDSMAIVDCNLRNSGINGMYVGSERIMILGNTVYNVDDSHVIRVWQAYQGVIAHNMASGSSLISGTGRHALKLHGPNPSEININPSSDSSDLRYATDYVVVSDNVFGSSGPWPVTIGPADSGQGAELTNILFERNRIITQYGTLSSTNVDTSLLLSGRYYTVRNNIIDGTSASSGYTGISVTNRGIEPAPLEVLVYNNTIFRADNNAGNGRLGISIGATTSSIEIKNNLIVFPESSIVPTNAIDDQSSTAMLDGNSLAPAASFIDAYNSDPLLRNFQLNPDSQGVNQGVAVPVFDDMDENQRPVDLYDIGAYEQ